MHVYIYDAFLNQNKFDSVLAKIETRITDLGLNGKIARLGIMKNLRETIENEVKRGAKTIIVVGNDYIFNEAISIMANKSIPLGLIPVDDGPNNIARGLGIKFGEKACDILSARRLEKLDLVSINNTHYLMEAEISSDGTTIEIDGKYSIQSLEPLDIKISNLSFAGRTEGLKISPNDGFFELFIEPRSRRTLFAKNTDKKKSVFSLTSLKLINTKKINILIDGVKEIVPPADIKIVKGGISIIVGRDRVF